jgi:hypothetical protein
VNREQDAEEEGHWLQQAVSWAQLLIALAAVVVPVLVTLIVDRVTGERRTTQLEERQAFVLRRLADIGVDEASFQRDVRTSLEALQKQLQAMTLEMARHQALEDRAAGNGVRIPRVR